MKKYFFLPKYYESLLAKDLTAFLQENRGFTIVTGVYKEFEGIITNENTLVSAKLITGTIQFVKRNYQNFFNKKKYDLIGFCLEGDLETFAPEYYAKILTLPDIKIFDNSIDYLNYINSLHND